MIYFLFFLSLGLAIGYVILIAQFLDGWQLTEEPLEQTSQNASSPLVSIIVAARNEENHIRECVTSILASDYKNFELIIIDNNSTDSTWEILHSINEPRLNLFQQNDGFKKESLATGVAQSKGKYLLFTDADCIVKPQWISKMVQAIDGGNDIVLGPIQIDNYSSAIERFQAMDMMAMMGITAGGLQRELIYLANGGNLAVRKELYLELSDKSSNKKASGDDVHLIHAAVAKNKYQIKFLKSSDVIVTTKALSSWKDLLEQRQRWASKTTSYVNKKDRYAAIFVFIFIASIGVNVILTPFTHGLSMFYAIFQLFIKGVVDFAFLTQVNSFFKLERLLKYFLQAFVIQNILFLWSGFSALFFKKYKWKGRITH